MHRHLCLLLVAVLLPGGVVAGQEAPLVGDRPDFTESAATIARGRLQIEGGFTRVAADAARLTTAGELLLRYGVGPNTEGRLTLGSYAWLEDPPFADTDGLTDIALGAKHRFVENAGLVPESALLVTATMPTGADGFTLEEVTPLVVGAFGFELSSNFGLGANLGWSHVYSPGDRTRYHTWWGSLSLAASLSSRLGAFAEVYGFNREEKDGDANGYADVGLTYLLNPNFQLDARVGQGFNGLDEDWLYGLGVVYRI